MIIKLIPPILEHPDINLINPTGGKVAFLNPVYQLVDHDLPADDILVITSGIGRKFGLIDIHCTGVPDGELSLHLLYRLDDNKYKNVFTKSIIKPLDLSTVTGVVKPIKLEFETGILPLTMFSIDMLMRDAIKTGGTPTAIPYTQEVKDSLGRYDDKTIYGSYFLGMSLSNVIPKGSTIAFRITYQAI